MYTYIYTCIYTSVHICLNRREREREREREGERERESFLAGYLQMIIMCLSLWGLWAVPVTVRQSISRALRLSMDVP